MSLILGKKVLFFAPKYFSYEKEIENMMKEMGAEVTYFDERPENTFFTKAFLRLNIRSFINRKINTYYDSILETIENQTYDIVFFVNPEAVPESFLKRLKKTQLEATFYVYMWDSILNKKNTLDIISYFDVAYTFDSIDSLEIEKFRFLPLFYIPAYERNLSYVEDTKKYDISFVGTAHSDRYKIVSYLKNYTKEHGVSFYSFLFVSSKLLFFARKYLTKELKWASINELDYQSMTNDEIMHIFNQSRVILDIESPNQIGLTMRTFELMALKKRMITTNFHIREYDFYREENIYILDRNNMKLDKEWLKQEWHNIPSEITEQYSLQNWLINIFK